jgi:hypothetical protein
VWIAKADAGKFDDDVAAAELLVTYEARIGGGGTCQMVIAIARL